MKKNQKIKAVCKSGDFISVCGGAKPNSPSFVGLKQGFAYPASDLIKSGFA